MSIVEILSHDETIYDVEKKEEAKIQKPPMYHSKFKEDTVIKFSHRTFGTAHPNDHDSSNYLRKDNGVRHPKFETNRICCTRRPPIPKLDELVTCSKKCKNDIIRENIRRAVTTTTKYTLCPRFCDTKNGDFNNLSRSGLFSKYIYQDKYGKTPNYIITRKKEFEKKMEMVNEIRESPYYKIGEQERKELLEGLRYNYEVEQTEYRRLPLLIDQLPKLLRKAKLESNLKQIEHDMVLMESQNIFVQKNK